MKTSFIHVCESRRDNQRFRALPVIRQDMVIFCASTRFPIYLPFFTPALTSDFRLSVLTVGEENSIIRFLVGWIVASGGEIPLWNKIDSSCVLQPMEKSSFWHWGWHKWRGIMDWIWNRRQKIYEKSVDAYGMDKQMLCRFCVMKLENESATERVV